nr:peptidoglycan-binding protein [Propionibacterium sp.]
MNVYPWSTIASGATTDRVAAIQYLLRHRGHPVAVDGVFGPATEAAVRAVQAAAGLEDDGVVGPLTWPVLVVQVGPGDSGEAVRAVQRLGLPMFPGDDPLVVDGVFGPATEEKIRAVQYNWGLTQDGIVGLQTWSFLMRVRDAWPLVSVGATQETNWRVLTVQHLLRAHGATIVADGSYGPLSGEAMRQFQLARRALYISTTCGQLDWPELIATVGPGDTGEAVKAAQCLLDVTVDGHFGPVTEAAVRAFQDVFLPPPTGSSGRRPGGHWWCRSSTDDPAPARTGQLQPEVAPQPSQT